MPSSRVLVGDLAVPCREVQLTTDGTNEIQWQVNSEDKTVHEVINFSSAVDIRTSDYSFFI